MRKESRTGSDWAEALLADDQLIAVDIADQVSHTAANNDNVLGAGRVPLADTGILERPEHRNRATLDHNEERLIPILIAIYVLTVFAAAVLLLLVA